MNSGRSATVEPERYETAGSNPLYLDQYGALRAPYSVYSLPVVTQVDQPSDRALSFCRLIVNNASASNDSSLEMAAMNADARDARVPSIDVDALVVLAQRMSDIPLTASAPPYLRHDASPEERERKEAEYKKEAEEERGRYLAERQKRDDEFREAIRSQLSKSFKDGASSAVHRAELNAWNARSVALYLLILAVVLMPAIAMIIRMSPQDFGSYMAPITGIAGTVVGYWFGASGRSGDRTGM